MGLVGGDVLIERKIHWQVALDESEQTHSRATGRACTRFVRWRLEPVLSDAGPAHQPPNICLARSVDPLNQAWSGAYG